MLKSLACACVVALAAGCFEPAIREGLTCGAAGECPPGQSCALPERICLAGDPQRPGDGEADGRGDGGPPSEDPQTDAGPSDPPCGDSVCELGEGCDDCSADCGECPAVCGDGTCDQFERCDMCPGDCGVCGGDCCAAHDTPGCDDPDGTMCVCSISAVCCQPGGWSDQCASILRQDICVAGLCD